jgi:hypothetical protein
MSVLFLLSAVTAPTTPVVAVVAPAPIAAPATTLDLSAPPSPHAPMRVAPQIGMSTQEALATLRPVDRSARPRWQVSF